MAVGDHDKRRQAWRRVRAQRRRAGELRLRVVAISVIAFVLLWAIVFTQMATGHDPVLGEGKHATSSAGSSGTAGRGAAEAETRTEGEAAPEAVESEAASGYGETEYEYAEPEYAESESGYEEEAYEPEPAPVVTSQS